MQHRKDSRRAARKSRQSTLARDLSGLQRFLIKRIEDIRSYDLRQAPILMWLLVFGVAILMVFFFYMAMRDFL